MSGIRAAALACAVLAGLPALHPTPAAAEPAVLFVQGSEDRDASAQRRNRRPPTRIEVYPRRQTYPGPGAVRECTSWLQPENRPSGPVIVPHMRCWWVPG